MNRGVSDRNILDKFAINFCKVLEKHARYIIVSGFVAISSGRVRGTEDIDMILERLTLKRFTQLHKDLIKNNFVCMQSDNVEEIYSYLTDRLSVRYTLKNKPLPEMEIKFAKDELDEIQLKERTKLKFTGLNVWFGSINMNVAFKEELLKSDKDLEDARHLRIVYSDLIDEEKINKFKKLIIEKRLKS